MKKKLYLPLFFAITMTSLAFAIEVREDIKELKVSPLEEKTELSQEKSEIKEPLEISVEELAKSKSFIDKVFSKVVIDLKQGPLFFLPIIDSSKDLGPNIGIMPIWALRSSEKGKVVSVIAPSVNYNEYLRTSVVYRHYFFPNDVQLWVARLSYSTVVQREIFLRYFNPEFMGTRYRINAEFRHWVTGKASFYGFGPDSNEGDKSTYALSMTGEEFSINFPLPKNLYFDFTHSFYSFKAKEGPLPTIPQLQDKYPAIFEFASERNDFTDHRFSIFYDTTDHPVVPKNGTYLGLSAKISIADFLSDFSYKTYAAQFKHYLNYKKQNKYITAFHALLVDTKGDAVPFYAQPVLGENTGLRSVGDGRFVDGGKLVFNLEERITITRIPVLKFFTELEISPFLDAGTVFGTLSGLQSENLHFGYGVAARIVIKPQIVAAADFAFGREGTNIIIHVGYPF